MTLAELQSPTDEDLIRGVIRSETEAFLRYDLEAWSDCWVHAPTTADVMFSSDIGLVAIRGWDQVRANMADVMERDMGCGKESFRQENFQITISGDMAWVLFDGFSHLRNSGVHETFETRVLQKSDGHWRIAYSSFVHKRSAAAKTTRVAVDGEGQIVWMPDSARERLRSHPGLIVSNGRLRARRPAWARSLADAFGRASQLHGFFDQFGYITRTGGTFRCPVVLGEDENGGIVTCIVTVLDGLTYVDIGADDGLDIRLQIAAAIFGLSPAQTDVAREIVAGHPLTEAAATLGITASTARTHLKRIFDKTGVNSQSALVRILLSVG